MTTPKTADAHNAGMTGKMRWVAAHAPYWNTKEALLEVYPLCDPVLMVRPEEFASLAATREGGDEIHFVCDGPPGPEAGRFVELEDSNGKSISRGRWEQRGNYWHLIIERPSLAALTEEADYREQQLREKAESLTEPGEDTKGEE